MPAGHADARRPGALRAAALPTDRTSIPRLTGFVKHEGAPRMFALVDEDGSLLRCIDNRDAG